MEATQLNFAVDDIEARRQGIGGSDCGSVLGVNRWRSTLEVYLEKIGVGEPTDFSDNEKVKWGNILEPVIAQEYMVRTGQKVVRCNKTLYHPRFKWMYVHLDRRIVKSDGDLEIKATYYKDEEWGEPGTDEIPMTYLSQCNHSMAVTGKKWMDVAALFFGYDLRFYRVERNEKLINMIIEKERVFWEEHVQKQVPPAPITLDDCKLLYEKGGLDPVTATQDVFERYQQYQETRQQLKALEKLEKEQKVFLQAYMEDHDTLLSPDRSQILATWKSQDSVRFDSKALKESNPLIHSQFQKKSSSRVFRPKTI